MELKIRKNGEVYIIDVNGEMDLYNSYKLKELVMKMLEKNVNEDNAEKSKWILIKNFFLKSFYLTGYICDSQDKWVYFIKDKNTFEYSQGGGYDPRDYDSYDEIADFIWLRK